MSRKSVADGRMEQGKEIKLNSTLHSDGTHRDRVNDKKLKKNLKAKKIFASLLSNRKPINFELWMRMRLLHDLISFHVNIPGDNSASWKPQMLRWWSMMRWFIALKMQILSQKRVLDKSQNTWGDSSNKLPSTNSTVLHSTYLLYGDS